jgi:hypothetical protein
MTDTCAAWATNIAPHLAPVAQRLPQLHITETWAWWERKQILRADFSRFSSLADLHVPAAM